MFTNWTKKVSYLAGAAVQPSLYRRKLKHARGLAKMPYYIEACLSRIPRLVTVAAFLARTVEAILVWSSRFLKYVVRVEL